MNNQENLIRGIFMFPVANVCQQFGLNLYRVLASAGLPANLLSQGNEQFPHFRFALLINEVKRLTQNDAIGIYWGQVLKVQNLGSIGYIMERQESIHSIYPCMDFIYRHITTGARHHVIIDKDNNRAFHNVEFFTVTDINYDQTALSALATIFTAFKQLFGDLWQPVNIHLQAQTSRNLKEVSDFFGCPVILNAKLNAMEYPLSQLYAKPKRSASYSKKIRREMSDILSSMQGTRELCIAHINYNLPLGKHKLADIAQSLGVHQRTLQTILKDRGVKYSQLLEESRQNRAKELLAQTNYSIEAIAGELGYKSDMAFIHAFNAWYGISPSKWRNMACTS